MTSRFRCRACGNLTRFNVVSTRRTQAFWHYSVGGDLAIEDETLVEETVDTVSCRWCGAGADSIESISADEAQAADGASEGAA